MTALEIAMAGYLAFGQLTGNSYEAITKHSGLHAVCLADAPCLTATGRELTECGLAVRLSGDYDSAVFEIAKVPVAVRTWAGEWGAKPEGNCKTCFGSRVERVGRVDFDEADELLRGDAPCNKRP